jgi:hypothetical protein
MPKLPHTALRWSLRTLFVLLTIVACLLGFVAFARAPRPIETRIRALGGAVGVSHPTTAWSTPMQWMDRLFGPFERYSEIYSVTVDSDEFEDLDCSAVCELGTLEALEIHSRNITDRGLSSLWRSAKIRELVLECPQISDNGLRSLQELRGLVSLEVSSNHISGQLLSNLDSRTRLRSLALVGERVDDSVCRRAVEFQELSEISLPLSGITDEGLDLLSGHIMLRYLDVTETRVTREGVKRFKSRCPHVILRTDL